MCQESHGSDPYSPQISSCSSTTIEFPVEQEIKTNVEKKKNVEHVFPPHCVMQKKRKKDPCLMAEEC